MEPPHDHKEPVPAQAADTSVQAAGSPASAVSTSGYAAPAPGPVTRAESTSTDVDSNTDSGADSGSEPLSPLHDPLEKVPTMISQLNRRHRRGSSVASDDSDPLAPLELALTPNLETEIEQAARMDVTHTVTATSMGSAVSRLPDYEVVFAENDPENPRYWPAWYRYFTLASVSFTTWVLVVYSTSYTAATPGLMTEFHVANEPLVTLGLTTYLIGLAVGGMVVAPMSELYGRRPVYIVSIICFTLLVIPAGLATSLAEILVVRFFGALFGASFVSNGPATTFDISNEDNRALYMSMVALAPMNGPVFGPIIGGFAYQYLGWRWDSWIVLVLSGTCIILTLFVKETYGPTILNNRAARKRKETNDDRYWCRYEERISAKALLKMNLSRPFILAATEPILWFLNTWISIVYAILYLCFVAYPIVFTEGRHWEPGMTGLAFLGIGIGTAIGICSEPLLRKLINSYPKDPETGRSPPEATARVMILGAVLTPLGQLVFSWTCLPATIHWAVPIAFGIPFGCGNALTFVYGNNYLAGAYGLYAASALAGNMVIRSLIGGMLPLAGTAMYKAMTPRWAGTFLGLLEVCLIPIPVMFLRYGRRIRDRSRVIRRMRADIEHSEAKRAKLARSIARQKAKRERQEAAVAAAVSAAADGDEARHSAATLASSGRDDNADVENTAARVQVDAVEEAALAKETAAAAAVSRA